MQIEGRYFTPEMLLSVFFTNLDKFFDRAGERRSFRGLIC